MDALRLEAVAKLRVPTQTCQVKVRAHIATQGELLHQSRRNVPAQQPHREPANMDMDEEENADIAAAMGFASFGGTKKRKFDHANSPKARPDVNDASGANSTKLGVRTKKVASAEDIDAEDLSSGFVHQEAQAQSNAPSRSKANQTADSGLASFLARGQDLPEHAPTTESASRLAAPVDQPVAEMISFGGPSISRAELNALRNGVRTDNGDTAYFLPSFVEDPWAKLRKGGSVTQA